MWLGVDGVSPPPCLFTTVCRPIVLQQS
jgi:hypothetical protein